MQRNSFTSHSSHECNQQILTRIPAKGTIRRKHEDSETNGLNAVKRDGMRVRRRRLESDVCRLQKRLIEEMDLRMALENAHEHAVDVIPSLPSHLPTPARKLLLEVASLECSVNKLEHQVISLHSELENERAENGQNYTQLTASISPPKIASSSGSSLEFEEQSFERGRVFSSDESNYSGEQHYSGEQAVFFDEWNSKHQVEYQERENGFSQPADKLSEEMVVCMMDIYHHLRLATSRKVSPLLNIASPTSPLGHLPSSSLSSVSESSLLSFAKSPLVDLRNRDPVIGSNNSFDPYQSHGKLPWAELGAYSLASEVSWLSVGKTQLEYAADALQRFKILVERLAEVDPSAMTHHEKLAFWINIYNALMMHAFLAYGTPTSEVKYFSLMQKASYTIGGSSFNAITIEHALLRGKGSMYRPQVVVLMALNKIKLKEEQINFRIDYQEPLAMFGLCYGAWSCPAVRIYSPDKVEEQLEAAVGDYVRASVGVNNRGKLLVPKLLYTYYASEQWGGGDGGFVEWVCEQLPSSQVDIIRECLQSRSHRSLGVRSFTVLPFDFRIL